MNYAFARAVAEEVLSKPWNRDWSVQGFGMLRAYFGADKRFRLNIWDSHLAVPLCSIIHDHPWAFDSLILAGEFKNQRYRCENRQDRDQWGASHEWQVIQTGPGGGPDGSHGFCSLFETATELYGPGDTYSQTPTEVHASYYTDGTITLNDRTRLPDGEHARVFWPVGLEWIDAIPHPATMGDIETVTARALARLKEVQ